MAATAIIGTLGAIIGLDTKPLQEGAKQAGAALGEVDKGMMGVINTAAKLGVAAVAAGAGIVSGLVVTGLKAIDAQAKMAQTMRGTITGIRALEDAAGDAGVTHDELVNSMQMLNVKLGEAQRLGSPAAKMLEQLGLKAKDLAAVDVDKRVAMIADKVKEMGLSSAQTADLMRQLGIRSSEFAILLQQGGDAIRAARTEVVALGRDLSDVDASKIEAANDALGIFGDVMQGIRDKVVVALAPFITELSNRFKALAIDNKGFADQASHGIEMMIRGFAKVADVIQGLRVVIKGAELIGVAFGAAMVSAVELAVTGFVKFENVVRNVVNKAIEYLNAIPGVEITPLELRDENTGFIATLHDMGEAAREEVGVVRQELHDLAMQELPSDKVAAFFADVQKRAQEAAEKTVQARNAIQGGAQGVEGFGVDDTKEQAAKDKAAKELAAYDEMMKGKLESLREFIATEAELETMQHDARMQQLRDFFDEEYISTEEFKSTMEELEQGHLDRLNEIRKQANDKQKQLMQNNLQSVAGIFGGLSAIYAQGAKDDKSRFETSKKLALGEAIVKTYSAVTAALNAAPGPPWSIPQAVATGLFGLAQVQAIRSTTFEGGGGGGGGGAPAAGATAPADSGGGGGGGGGSGGGGRQVVAVEGVNADSLFTGRQLRTLWENLMGVVEDGNRSGVRTEVIFS